jgi:hypothetical protein
VRGRYRYSCSYRALDRLSDARTVVASGVSGASARSAS